MSQGLWLSYLPTEIVHTQQFSKVEGVKSGQTLGLPPYFIGENNEGCG